MKRVDLILDQYGELEDNEHGGACCGRRHLFGFPSLDELVDDWDRPTRATLSDKVEYLAQFVQKRVPSLTNNRPGGQVTEVVLTKEQCRVWRRALQVVGFKQVWRFINNGSGNELFVFFFDSTPEERKK